MKKFLDFKFLKEAGLLSSSNLLNSASNGIIIILLNKYLPSNESGIFLFLLSVASPLFIFISFDLRRKVTARQLDGLTLPEIFTIRNILALLGLLLFIGISFIVSNFDAVSLTALACIGIGKLFDSVTEINYAIFQYYNVEKRIFISRLIKLLACGLIFLFAHTNSYYVIFLLFTVTNLIPFMVYELWSLKKLDNQLKLTHLKINFKTLKTFIVSNSNLAFASLIMTLSPNIPTYFVKYYMDIEYVTYFSSINFIISTIYLTGSGIGFAMLKKLGKSGKANDRQNFRLMVKSSGVTLLSYLLFGVAIFLVDGLTLVFNENYNPFYLLLNLLLCSGFLFTVSSYLNNYLIYLNEQRFVLQLRILRIISTVILCFILPRYFPYLTTFAYCLIITNLIDCLVHLFLIVKKRRKISYAQAEEVFGV